jgi:Zn-dependent protease with chaperone function
MAGPPNAFTFGTGENPVIVVDGRLVEGMGSGELQALLGHEMGHIKNGHMLYHSLAQTLAQTVAVSASLAGFSLISMPMRLALLAWQRASEFSADRAALLACGSYEQVVSLFAKLNGIPVTSLRENVSFIDEVTKLFQTHPHLSERARAVFEFSKTPEYVKISNQTNARRMFRLAFSPTCRFCSSSKSINATFCPTCGKSQV